MYERMLDKSTKPSMEELTAYCGGAGAYFTALRDSLTLARGMDAAIRFPYGNSYGWGVKYSIKGKHFCDVFAENGSFCVMLRMTGAKFALAYPLVSDNAKAAIDNKYPCGDGGYVHYRVASAEQLDDILKLFEAKLSK